MKTTLKITLCLFACIVSATAATSSDQIRKQYENPWFAEYTFTDFLGNRKSVTRPIAFLNGDLTRGLDADGSSIAGCTRITNSDILLKPDTLSIMSVPWTQNDSKTIRFSCDMYLSDDVPCPTDPRYILRKTLEEARTLGYDFLVGPELEFYCLEEKNGQLFPVDHGTYFDPANQCFDDGFKITLMNALMRLGVNPEKWHHEVGPGQFEISLKYDNALLMADRIIATKHAINSIAALSGKRVTFMPKPMSGKPGNGMHIHFSLYDMQNDRNAFCDANDANLLSPIAKSFIAGVLAHVQEINLLLNYSVNSYKRLGGHEAPKYICCGKKNRSSLIRLPQIDGDMLEAVRAEIRSPDALCNPYLAFAALLKAGLDGIKNNMELTEVVTDNLYEADHDALAMRGINLLPRSMEEALDTLRNSAFARDLLGQELFDQIVQFKDAELADYNHAITNWEIEHYR